MLEMRGTMRVSSPSLGASSRYSAWRCQRVASSRAWKFTHMPHAKGAKGPAVTAEEPTSIAVQLTVQEMREKLQLYNTLARTKQPFRTRSENPNRVQMYVCGVTVYDYSHIGHARVYVAFDVLYRILQYLQYDVQYVRNFTDIDDKIIARANQNGEDPLALSQRFIHEFHKDMVDLGCLSPSLEPKATDYIPQMISTIERIIANGHAYAVEGGDVYFEVDTLPGYGKLSGRAQEDNRAGERVDVDRRKRGPADFALWKSAKPGEPSWASPWGHGRPGWHIECSSMIAEVMGNIIDIHGGGRDLVFPHHENELAQSRAAAGSCSCGSAHGHAHAHAHQEGSGEEAREEFVRYWLHNGFVNVDSEKMSKSLGNFFTIREVVAQYHPLALRWFLVSTHYRQQVNYTQRALEEASDRLYYVYQALLDVGRALEAAGQAGVDARQQAAAEFLQGRGSGPAVAAAATLALLDDLNTPSAVSELSAPLKLANDLLSTKAGKKRADRLAQLAHVELAVAAVLQLLGLTRGSAGQEEGAATGPMALPAEALHASLAEMRQLALSRAGLSQEEVAARLADRAAARAAKDFARGDEIRLELEAKGVMVMDTAEGSSWRPGLPQAEGS